LLFANFLGVNDYKFWTKKFAKGLKCLVLFSYFGVWVGIANAFESSSSAASIPLFWVKLHFFNNLTFFIEP
jgi:hypothetical protein